MRWRRSVEDSDAKPRPLVPTRELTRLIVFAGLFSAFTAATIVLSAQLLQVNGEFRPEILLPLLLVAGVIALVISLTILVSTFKLFDLADRDKPFGLPEGTLQAVIALMLIMVFSITALYLRGTFRGDEVTVTGLTQAQVDQIPATEITGLVPLDGGLFEVARRIPVDQEGKDFSNQLLTILGTLMGAVSGFYFGAKAVQTGVSAGGGNVPPTSTSPPGIEGGGSPRVGETLRGGGGGWTGSPPPAYTYQWQRQLPNETDWRDIKGATASTYLVTPEDRRALLRLAVSAKNSAGEQVAYSEATTDVRQLPTMTSEPTIAGRFSEGEELQANPGKWDAWPPQSYSYQWERSVLQSEDWQAILKASATMYRLVRDDVGTQVRVLVTAKNEVGSSESPSKATDPVAGDAANVTLPTATGSFTEGGVLQGDPGEWTGWPLSFKFTWERQAMGTTTWEAISYESTYHVTRKDVGGLVRLTVASGEASETSQTYGPITGPPANESRPVVAPPGSPLPGATLTAQQGLWPAFPEAMSYTYRWQSRPSEGAEWSEVGQGPTYVVSTDDVGKRLRVIETATNEIGSADKESEPTEAVEALPGTGPQGQGPTTQGS